MAEEEQSESRQSGLGRHREGTPALLGLGLGLGFHLCPREGALVFSARTTWGLQHALADLTVTVSMSRPRHAVIYNPSETRF